MKDCQQTAFTRTDWDECLGSNWEYMGANKEQDSLIDDEEDLGRATALEYLEDMTSELISRTYWPSINRPYFDDVRQHSGYPITSQNDEEDDTNNDFFSFENRHK